MTASIPSLTQMVCLLWGLWTIAAGMTAFRLTFQWRQHGRLFAGDYFVIAGLVTLTAMGGVITKILPHGYFMAQLFSDLSRDPFMPMPIPPEEIRNRNIENLKYTFSLLPLFWTTVWAVGCSRPDDFARADASIKFATAADIASDLLTMILPLNLLRNLSITKLQKLWLVTVFSLSGIIIAVALVRMLQVLEVTDAAKQDLLVAVKMLLARCMWSHIESTVAIIVATLPALRFLGKKRMVKEKLPNSYGLVTIGGTGRSRPMPWQLDAGSDESVTIQGSHSELEEAHDKGSYGISDIDIDHMGSGLGTRPGTEVDEESQSVRRCV
ncbi:hypothetical protein E4U54_007895 [Claviceps lovelessii]|nr:hypothetical protein E4U54_007895 [Claviceps lovelessii]